MQAIGRGYMRFALAEPELFSVALTRSTENTDDESTKGVSGLSARELLYGALDDLVDAGELAVDDREAAATLAWATVHGLSLLFLGPMSDVPAGERDGVIEDTLALIGRGFLIRR